MGISPFIIMTDTTKITEEDLKSDLMGISVRLPKGFATKIKARASLRGLSRDIYIKNLLIVGLNSETN